MHDNQIATVQQLHQWCKFTVTGLHLETRHESFGSKETRSNRRLVTSSENRTIERLS
jgi:hypothetical protein